MIDSLTALIFKLSSYVSQLLSQCNILKKETLLITTSSNTKQTQERTSWKVLSDIHNLSLDEENKPLNIDCFNLSFQDEKTKHILQRQIFQFNDDDDDDNNQNNNNGLKCEKINNKKKSDNKNVTKKRYTFIKHDDNDIDNDKDNSNNDKRFDSNIIDFHDIWIAGIKLAINLTPTTSLINNENKILETTFKSVIEFFSWRVLQNNSEIENHSNNHNNNNSQPEKIDLPLNVSIVL